MDLVVKYVNGEEQSYDLSPVMALIDNASEGKSSVAEFDKLTTLNELQLRHMASIALATIRRLSRLYQSSFSRAHVKLAQDIHELQDLAAKENLELWPEVK